MRRRVKPPPLRGPIAPVIVVVFAINIAIFSVAFVIVVVAAAATVVIAVATAVVAVMFVLQGMGRKHRLYGGWGC